MRANTLPFGNFGNLAWQPSFAKEDFFVTLANFSAFRIAGDCPDSWGNEAVQLVVGPEGCGKSHLAAIYSHSFGAGETGGGATRIDPHTLARHDWDSLDAAASSFFIDDAESIARHRDSEVGLQHFLDRLQVLQGAQGAEGEAHGEAQGRLLLTARVSPGEWGCHLPDLVTRLAALSSTYIVAPDDMLLEGVLAKLFADRQIRPGSGVLHWLLQRVERSYTAAAEIVEKLDRISLETGRELRLPLVIEALEQV